MMISYITNHIEFNLFVISNIIKVSKLYRNFYLKYKKELSIYSTFINNNYINIFIDRIIVKNKLYLHLCTFKMPIFLNVFYFISLI